MKIRCDRPVFGAETSPRVATRHAESVRHVEVPAAVRRVKIGWQSPFFGRAHFRILLSTACLVVLSGCTPPPEPAAFRLDDFRLLDLTHAYDEKTLYWPTEGGFEHERTAWGINEKGYWYSSYRFAGSEHGGTHLDAPIHFAEGAEAVGDIPIERLTGPGVVIDITEKCAADPDALLTVDDIEAHQTAHGPIAAGSVVLVRTGWASHWPDAAKYLGSDVAGDASNLHFPGVSEEAAQLLVKRKITVVGIDTASIDRGASTHFEAHQVFAAAGIACLENVARLDELPATGATVFALPMKIAAGSGAPCRILALVPR